MINSKRTLDMLEIDKYAKIEKIECSETIRRRLYDLGLIDGTKIKALYKSPFGDPSAYLIKGAVIALRHDDTKHITILDVN